MNMTDVLRIVNYLLRLLREAQAPRITTTGLPDDPPTQKDKPSPSSHFMLPDLRTKLQHDWPTSEGYVITGVANTNSMEPWIDDNTLVVHENHNHSRGKTYRTQWPLRVGDVCVYRGNTNIFKPQPNGDPALIIHRIIRARSAGDGSTEYLFQGDNNYLPDPLWVREDDIIWRTCLVGYARQYRKGD